MTQPEFTVEFLAPESLVPHDLNPRRHPDQQKEALRQSLAEHGYLSAPIVNLRTGKRILDGHARVELALANGEAAIPCRVIDVPEAQEKRILRMFDAIGGLAEIDTAALDRLIEAIDDAQLERLLGELSEPESGLLADADPDAMPEQVETRCQPGDLWLLGEHRLLCGDCTVATEVDRLMGGRLADCSFTDPPYGIGYRSGRPIAGNEKEAIEGDETPAELAQLLRDWVPLAFATLKPGAALWACCTAAGPTVVYPLVLTELARAFAIQDTVAWDKQHYGTGWLLRRQWEAIILCAKGKLETWNGGHDQPNVVRYPRLTPLAGDHPTPKPVELVSDFIGWVSDAGAFVTDFFAGSGTTLIACEQTGRVARCMEIEPRYCDVILARWGAATGQKAKLQARSA